MVPRPVPWFPDVPSPTLGLVWGSSFLDCQGQLCGDERLLCSVLNQLVVDDAVKEQEMHLDAAVLQKVTSIPILRQAPSRIALASRSVYLAVPDGPG